MIFYQTLEDSYEMYSSIQKLPTKVVILCNICLNMKTRWFSTDSWQILAEKLSNTLI